MLAPRPIILIADAPVFHTVGGRMAVMCPELAKIGRRVAIDVFYPFQGLPECSRKFGVVAHVEIDIGLGADFPTPFQELIGAELVILNPAPMVVFNRWPQRFGANTIPPTVLMDDGAPRPPHYRYLEVA